MTPKQTFDHALDTLLDVREVCLVRQKPGWKLEENDAELARLLQWQQRVSELVPQRV